MARAMARIVTAVAPTIVPTRAPSERPAAGVGGAIITRVTSGIDAASTVTPRVLLAALVSAARAASASTVALLRALGAAMVAVTLMLAALTAREMSASLTPGRCIASLALKEAASKLATSPAMV